MAAKTTSITISGPGVDRSAPNLGAALSGALTFAGRAVEPSTFYVREEGQARYVVERDDSRVITTKEVPA